VWRKLGVGGEEEEAPQVNVLLELLVCFAGKASILRELGQEYVKFLSGENTNPFLLLQAERRGTPRWW
jgi:hypothetical protein